MPSTTQNLRPSDDNTPLTGSNSQQSADGTSEATAPAPDNDESQASSQEGDIAWDELQSIVAPLPAFLVANTDPRALDSHAIPPWVDPYSIGLPVRVCYALHPAFFHTDTPLDEMLLALLRVSRRNISTGRFPLIVTTELSHNMGATLRATWSSLVFSMPRDVTREECMASVSRIMRFISQPRNITPLTNAEREIFGKSPTI